MIRKRGEPRWIRLAGSGAGGAWSAADDELPGQFRRVISSPPGTVPQSHQEIARRLFEQRLQPLRGHLEASAQLPPAKHLVILSARSMAGIPLEALSDQFTISYAPSGTVFAWLQEERKKPRTDRDSLGPRLLALGDPVYESRALPVVKRGPAPPLGRIRKSGLSAAGASFPRFKDALAALRLMA